MSSTLRLRRKPLLEVVQNFDAFEKVPEKVREEKRLTGGLIFIIFASLIAWLVVSEFHYYTSTRVDYRFTVDTEFDTKLQIGIDIVVSMPCHAIGADVMDATERPLIFTENQLKMDPVDYELSDVKRHYWNMVRQLKKLQKPGQAGLDNLLFVKSDPSIDDEKTADTDEKKTEENTDENGDDGNVLILELDANGWHQRSANLGGGQRSNKKACRIHGYVKVNKVEGNLHITAGKSLPFIGGGHLHISQLGGPSYNFSHRIQRLAFGPSVSGLMNPLDGVEEINTDAFHMYQYYAHVVPTKVHSLLYPPVDTCQYSLSKRHRSIDHSQGSHGMPGIFIKYELNPIKVDVYETHRSYVEFAVRLCAIIGGVFATSGIINMLISGLFNLLFCRNTGKRDSSSLNVLSKETAITNGVDGGHPPLTNPSFLRPSDREYGQAFIT